MGSSKVLAWVLTILLVISSAYDVHSWQSNYYEYTCPDAKTTVANVVQNAIHQNLTVGPGLLRMFFHDCFVEGCDASILIDSAYNRGDSEKDAVPNLTLHSFEIIDQAKAAVENICPQTVSCADVLAFAAATSVEVLGGPRVDIQGGRLDGFVSSSNAATQNLPSPLNTLTQLQTLFSTKGLDSQDLVILSGAHTIGKAHCGAFTNRLYPTVDPSMNSDFAGSLEQQCPSATSTNLVNNDVQTPNYFDNAYHQNVVDGKALFTSDAQLDTSSSTSGYVNQYASNNDQFLCDFANALIKMGQVDLKTGSNGNVRTTCYAFN